MAYRAGRAQTVTRPRPNGTEDKTKATVLPVAFVRWLHWFAGSCIAAAGVVQRSGRDCLYDASVEECDFPIRVLRVSGIVRHHADGAPALVELP
jgi:hypothetical protein